MLKKCLRTAFYLQNISLCAHLVLSLFFRVFGFYFLIVEVFFLVYKYFFPFNSIDGKTWHVIISIMLIRWIQMFFWGFIFNNQSSIWTWRFYFEWIDDFIGYWGERLWEIVDLFVKREVFMGLRWKNWTKMFEKGDWTLPETLWPPEKLSSWKSATVQCNSHFKSFLKIRFIANYFIPLAVIYPNR